MYECLENLFNLSNVLMRKKREEPFWQSILTLDGRSNDRVVLHVAAVPTTFAATRHSSIVRCTLRHSCNAPEISSVTWALLPDTLDRAPILQLEVTHDDRVDISGHLLASPW